MMKAFGRLTDRQKGFKRSDSPPGPAASPCGAEPPHTTSWGGGGGEAEASGGERGEEGGVGVREEKER